MNLNKAQIFAAIALAANLTTAGQAADASHGEVIAKRWCAACHVVAPDQKQGSDKVPSFVSIAKRPGFDTAKLAFFLLDPHPKMPNMSLTRGEAEDIAAYIARLGR
jgi:mono/diheme cytochrome c family protein